VSDPRPIEYLYGERHCPGRWDCICSYGMDEQEKWDYHHPRFQITKKTAKRVCYVYRWSPYGDEPEEIRCVDRQKLEADGEVYRRSGRLGESDFPVYLRPLERPQPLEPAGLKAGVSQLRAEMADAHPDRGGSSEAFIEAHRRYLAAKGRAS
jgi:hypothetical protein